MITLGCRVMVYCDRTKAKARVVGFPQEKPELIAVVFDMTNVTVYVWKKQCRVLKPKKPPQEYWIQISGNTVDLSLTPEPGYMHVREVRNDRK